MNFTRGRYNPGMNPFAPQPVIRFDGDKTIGDAGVTYEFNVKLHRVRSNATEEQWSFAARDAFDAFETYARGRWPWVGAVYQNGRSGGWLAVEDPQGRMTKRTLAAMQTAVEKALAKFKRHMVTTYPQRTHG
jgi:hypothetical protein